MNAKKAKAIRRAFKDEIAKGSGERWIVHPSLYVNTQGTTMLHYNFQYFTTGAKKLIKVAKKIYKLSGLLPGAYGAN